jgi:hypothetical protein
MSLGTRDDQKREFSPTISGLRFRDEPDPLMLILSPEVVQKKCRNHSFLKHAG